MIEELLNNNFEIISKEIITNTKFETYQLNNYNNIQEILNFLINSNIYQKFRFITSNISCIFVNFSKYDIDYECIIEINDYIDENILKNSIDINKIINMLIIKKGNKNVA